MDKNEMCEISTAVIGSCIKRKGGAERKRDTGNKYRRKTYKFAKSAK